MYRAFERLNWSADTPLEQGLRQTAQWYRAQLWAVRSAVLRVPSLRLP